jgi:hypothetical protein
MALRSIRRHVRTELRPVHAAVDGFVHVLRAVIDDVRVVRVDLDRRLPHEPVHHLLGVLAVALLRVDPVLLLLPGRHIHACELALAVAVDDLSRRNRPDLPALAAGQRHPQLPGVVRPP